MRPVEKAGGEGITLASLTKNMVDHIGRDKVDPQIMPWQYRK